MTNGAIASIVTGGLTVIVLCISGVLWFVSLLVLLNGFMGQERAVNGAFITYIGLSVIALLVCAGGGSWLTYYLSVRRTWSAFGSAVLAIFLACAIGIGVQLVSVFAAAIVADQLRTNRK